MITKLQQLANETQKKIYRYELTNGNRFLTLGEPMKLSQLVQGSKIKGLIEIIKPEINMKGK